MVSKKANPKILTPKHSQSHASFDLKLSASLSSHTRTVTLPHSVTLSLTSLNSSSCLSLSDCLMHARLSSLNFFFLSHPFFSFSVSPPASRSLGFALCFSAYEVLGNILFFWFWLLDFHFLGFFFFFISLGFISNSQFMFSASSQVLRFVTSLIYLVLRLKLICYLDVMNLFAICHLDVNVMTNELIYLALLKVYYVKDDCFLMLLC